MTVPEVEIYYNILQYLITTIIKTIWHWHTDRHKYQQKRIQSLEKDPCIYGQLMSDKGAKTTQ